MIIYQGIVLFMKVSQEDYYNIPWKQRNGIYEVKGFGTYYYVNGKLHREDGPAIEYIFGDKHWHFNDNLHRLDGPAVEYFSGEVYYYINGKQYPTKEEFESAAYMYLNGLMDYL